MKLSTALVVVAVLAAGCTKSTKGDEGSVSAEPDSPAGRRAKAVASHLRFRERAWGCLAAGA